MAIAMTPRIPDPAKIAEVDGYGQGSRNSAERRHSAVVIPFLLRSPLGGHVGEREVEGGGKGRPAHQEVEVAARERRGSWMSCALLSLGPPLYIGGGMHPCPLPKATKGGGHEEARAAAASQGGARSAPPENLTLAG
jgi:hypothetical protein